MLYCCLMLEILIDAVQNVTKVGILATILPELRG